MKKLKTFVILTTAACLSLLILSCNRQKAPKMVTEIFKADFTGEYKYAGPDTLSNPKCTGQLALWRAIVDGKGTSTPFGDFTVHFDFCGDSLSNYGNSYAYMVSADSDTLLIDVSGRVIGGRLDDHPEHVTSYWRDSIRFIGGTGKFVGATGKGITDDYNSSEDTNSHHRWTGTITLNKESE